MGMFSFIEKGLGLRTGATQAAKAATEAGEVSLADQTALKEEIGSIYNPAITAGNEASQSLSNYYNGDQQAIINQAQSSPFMSSLVNQGESAIARNAQMTGGFRTGTTQENLAQNSQNVLQSLVNETLQGKQALANTGTNAQDAYTVAMQNIVNGTSATRGEIANIGVAQAANSATNIGNIVGAGTKIATAFI